MLLKEFAINEFKDNKEIISVLEKLSDHQIMGLILDGNLYHPITYNGKADLQKRFNETFVGEDRVTPWDPPDRLTPWSNDTSDSGIGLGSIAGTVGVASLAILGLTLGYKLTRVAFDKAYRKCVNFVGELDENVY
jgi:hypothetical protein